MSARELCSRRRDRIRSSARAVALLAAVLGASSGCAHRMGRGATSGALAGLREAGAEAVNTPEDQQVSRLLAQRAIEGAMQALDTPEQRARIEQIVAGAVESATRTAADGMTSQLIEQLGPDGQGPLGRSLANTGHQITAAIVRDVMGGVGNELAALGPECYGVDRATCIQQRLHAMARSTAAGFTAGVKDNLGWQFLLLAFAAGTVAGALGSWLWSRGHSRSRRRFQPA
jgi:hypothetical protein